jgi:asparagine synthase (glutamine-hydrolysing)
VCGIAGFTTKNWSPEPERIYAATATIRHRGPDQQGVFRSRACSLGAARLAIVDLAGGDQPIRSADGDVVIVFNGEVYNHLEVRAELLQRGHQMRSHCDTETVLHAFLEWDVACLSRLRGMFALAIWTESKRRLLLARDRLGIKPLYISRLGDDLLFASELKALFAHPELDRQLSLAGLDCYLSLNYVPGPWTLIEGIEKLAPGQWLEWRDGREHTERYWQIPVAAPRTWRIDDAKAELDRLLQSSVREHMMADVALGVWLSGGVDSSTILHYAAQESSAPLRTYSISFRGHSFDESRYVEQMVARYRTEHQQLDVSPELDLEQAIAELAYFCDEPMADSGALPVWYLAKLSKAGCTVALSGEGADEVFGGYLTYRANGLARQARRAPSWLLQGALGGLQRWPVSDEKISFEYKLKRLLEGSLMPPARGHVYWNGTFSDREKRELTRVPLPHALTEVLHSMRAESASDRLSPYMEFDQQYYLPDDILVKSDRMSMAHSLEVRPPFLDHRIVEFAATLPPEMKVRGPHQKVLLKEWMAPLLPPSVTQRSKIGFDIPAHEWFRGPLRPLWLRTLNAAAQEHAETFDFDALRRLTDLHINRRVNIGYHLWGLMTLFTWMDRWKVQAAPSLSASSRLQPVQL